jgi:hypothetical protein
MINSFFAETGKKELIADSSKLIERHEAGGMRPIS